MPETVKYVSAGRILAHGILQELNRLFLHPLGYAAEVHVDDGHLRLQDHTDDPAGVIFAPQAIDMAKAEVFAQLQHQSHQDRERKIGFIIQPLPAPKAAAETVWLIESPTHGPRWLGRSCDPSGGAYWTNDPQRAIRFSRKEDAEAIIRNFSGDYGFRNARAIEHMFS